MRRWIIAVVLGTLAGLPIGCGDECDECPTSPSGPAAIVVKPDGSGDFATIQAAIDAADSLDVIELADGIYSGTGNRDLDFRGKTITVRSRSGNPATCVIDCQGSESDPHYGFRFVSGETSGSRLEGVTIRDGYSTSGGGILCDGSSPTILGCRLTGNTASLFGGGIALSGASPLLSQCSLINNRATAGAGLYYQEGSLRVMTCEFSGNYAGEMGGGIAGEHGSLVVSGCTFRLNGAGEAGGGIRCFYGSVEIAGSTFDRNSAVEAGGGVSVEDVELSSVTGCLFTENSSQSGGGLGAAGNLTVLLSTFAENAASAYGGAMVLTAASAVRNCTLVGNSAFTGGGGILVGGEDAVSVDRTVIAFSTLGEAIQEGAGATVTLTCCDLFGNEGGDWTDGIAGQLGAAGNISEDPLFCDWESGSYALSYTSPCVSDSCGIIGAWPAACDSR